MDIRTIGCALVGALLLGVPREADAYTIESVASEGCHERITSEALRRVRSDGLATSPIAESEEDRALINDLQFNPDDDMRDIGAVALLLGVRDNDLKGRGSDDLTNLAQVHGNPTAQEEHCLRAAAHDEPDGTAAALTACRTYIEERFARALEGLDASGRPSVTARTELAVHLATRGDVDVRLPAFYVPMGQALHALEDGFSHAYRTADGKRVIVALNWLEVVGETHVESRDGPPHSADLDACDDADELRTVRRERATDAAEALLRAALGPDRTREERLAAARAVLDEYLGFEAGCTADNGWCSAPEAAYDRSQCACEAAGSARGATLAPWAAGIAAALALRRMRRRRASLVAASLAFALVALGARTADAHPTPQEPRAEGVPPPNVVPIQDPGPENPNALAWGGALTVAGAVDKAGFAGALGGRLRFHPHWAAGLDVEWNPFISITGGEPVRSGVFNAYATVMARFPLAYQPFNLRSSLSLGSSTLLTDLYGAPALSTGVFVGANFLGIEFKISEVAALVLNPLGIAIPVPQLTGIPFLYPQYRLSFSVELYGT